ncbi:hypothetical protein AAY473_039265 [Plecturocebus cupreus]
MGPAEPVPPVYSTLGSAAPGASKRAAPAKRVALATRLASLPGISRSVGNKNSSEKATSTLSILWRKPPETELPAEVEISGFRTRLTGGPEALMGPGAQTLAPAAQTAIIAQGPQIADWRQCECGSPTWKDRIGLWPAPPKENQSSDLPNRAPSDDIPPPTLVLEDLKMLEDMKMLEDTQMLEDVEMLEDEQILEALEMLEDMDLLEDVA